MAMSLTVILIGAAHGVPVLLASVISKRKWVAIAVALGMLYVAFNTGGQAYLGADVLGIIAGTIFSWFFSKPPESDERRIEKSLPCFDSGIVRHRFSEDQRNYPEALLSTNPEIRKTSQTAGEKQHLLYERNQFLDNAAKEFGSKLLVKWAQEALWKEDNDFYGTERKRSICEKFVRCSFDPSRAHQLLEKDFLYQVMAEAKDCEAAKRIYMRTVPDCLDMGILPPKQTKKFRQDFEQAYEEEQKREADETWRRATELANEVLELDRQKRS